MPAAWPIRPPWRSRPTGGCSSAEQGGQLRVIKNGVLLPTPFVTRDRQRRGRARPAGRRVRPELRDEPASSTSTTRRTTPTIHNRVSRFTANGERGRRRQRGRSCSNLRTCSAPPTTTAARSTSAPTASCTSPSARTPTAPTRRRSPTRSARCCGSTPTARIPADNPFFSQTHRRQPGDLGARPAQPVHVRLPAGHRPDVHQRRRPEHLGGDQRRRRRRQLRLARHRRRRRPNPRLRSAALFAYSHGTGPCQGCAITGGAFYNPTPRHVSRAATSATTSSPTTAAAGSIAARPGTATSARFATGISRPSTLPVGPRRQPLLSRARIGGVVYRIAFTGSQAPPITQHPANQTMSVGQSATFTVAASRRAAAELPVAAQRQRHSAAPRRRRYTFLAATSATTARSSACVVTNASGSATSNAATLTVTSNQPPVADDHRAGRRHALHRRQTDRLRRHRHRSRRRHAAAERVHLADRFPPRRPHPPVYAADERRHQRQRSTIPHTGDTETNVWYRVHLTVTDSAG